jgi:hypothetical protein
MHFVPVPCRGAPSLFTLSAKPLRIRIPFFFVLWMVQVSAVFQGWALHRTVREVSAGSLPSPALRCRFRPLLRDFRSHPFCPLIWC